MSDPGIGITDEFAQLIDGDTVTDLRVEQLYNVMPAVSLKNRFADVDISIPQNPGLAENNWNSGHQDSYCSESVDLTGPTGKKLRLIKQYNPYGFCAIMACNKKNQFIGMAYAGKFSIIAFDTDCHILAASEVYKKDSPGFSGGYFFLNNEDNAVVVADTALACYSTANIVPKDEVSSIDLIWKTCDLVVEITKPLTQKNQLYGSMPMFTTKRPNLYWVVLAGIYDKDTKTLESNAYVAVIEITPDPTKKDGCVTRVLDKRELKNQWNNNTFAASEEGFFLVTNGCNPDTGECNTGFLQFFGFDLIASKITTPWEAPYSYDNWGLLKPGQKNIGSGTTPTLFQGSDKANLVAFTDNDIPQMKVVIVNRDNGKVVEEVPVFAPMRGCDDASLIGVNGHVVVENNFGHTQNSLHSQYVPNEPGIAMIEVKPNGGHSVVWENSLYPSSMFAMSMLARKSGIIYAHTGEWNVADSSHKGGLYNIVAIDSWDGRVIWRIPIGQGKKYCHEYGGVYFNRTGTGTGIYIGTERYLVSIQDYDS